MSAEWDSRFLDLAQHVGQWSKDRSRKVGCIIIGPQREIRAMGYNGFPRGIDDAESARHERPDKYLWTEHAERNAIFQAARIGTPLDGCTMYLSWFPCMACARAIVQSGIARLVAAKPDIHDPQWGEEFEAALSLLGEAAVAVDFVETVTPMSARPQSERDGES
jgi:dCMP deaminase